MTNRPFVNLIAYEIEKTLRANESKPAWESQLYSDNLSKFLEEHCEFMAALHKGCNTKIISEGFDLICSIAMLMTKHGFGNPEWERGRHVQA